MLSFLYFFELKQINIIPFVTGNMLITRSISRTFTTFPSQNSDVHADVHMNVCYRIYSTHTAVSESTESFGLMRMCKPKYQFKKPRDGKRLLELSKAKYF